MTEMSMMSEMSQMSQMSGLEPSTVDPTGTEDSGDWQGTVFAVVLCLLLLGLVVFVVYSLTGSVNSDTTDEGDSGSSGNGGNTGGPTGDFRPAPLTTTKATTKASTDAITTTATPTAITTTTQHTATTIVTTATTTPTTTTTTTATTTTTLQPRQELICTVDLRATMASFYPNDRMCQYLYYTHVQAISDEIKPTEGNTSYTVFEQVVAGYTVTEGGFSFDMRHVDNNDLGRPAIQTILSGAKRNSRIYHLGSLNIQFDIGDMTARLGTAEKMLQILKKIQQGHAASKTIVALGTFDFSNTKTWDTFKGLVKRATGKNFMADTVILISSYSAGGDIAKRCLTVPPNALDATSNGQYFPSLKRLGELVKASYTDYDPHVVLGLSLEMGALAYKITRNITSVSNNEVYQRCTEAALMSTQLGCQTKEVGATINSETQTAISLMKGRTDHIVLWDPLSTIKSKMAAVKGWPPRRRFAWLLFNVHLIDLNRQCVKSTQASILGEINGQFPYTT